MSENGMVRPCSGPASEPSSQGGTEDKGVQTLNSIAVIGIDIGKNSFHIVGQGVEPINLERALRNTQ